MESVPWCLDTCSAIVEESVTKLRQLRKLSALMAEDQGLWFHAGTCAEAYLQQELRKLCAAIEQEGRAAELPSEASTPTLSKTETVPSPTAAPEGRDKVLPPPDYVLGQRHALGEAAQWMITRSYATGHGDTVSDLMAELVDQVREQTIRSLKSPSPPGSTKGTADE